MEEGNLGNDIELNDNNEEMQESILVIPNINHPSDLKVIKSGVNGLLNIAMEKLSYKIGCQRIDTYWIYQKNCQFNRLRHNPIYILQLVSKSTFERKIKPGNYPIDSSKKTRPTLKRRQLVSVMSKDRLKQTQRELR
jgi:hypothetical protein